MLTTVFLCWMSYFIPEMWLHLRWRDLNHLGAISGDHWAKKVSMRVLTTTYKLLKMKFGKSWLKIFKDRCFYLKKTFQNKYPSEKFSFCKNSIVFFFLVWVLLNYYFDKFIVVCGTLSSKWFVCVCIKVTDCQRHCRIPS